MGNPLTSPIPEEIQTLANIGAYDYHHGDPNLAIDTEALQGAIWTIEYNQAYNTYTNTLTVDGGPTIDAMITADIAYAVAHPAAFSLGLYPTANGQGQVYGQGFSPGIPEPSTWAMVLLGFAGLGYAAYHQGRKDGVAFAN
jgi:hypothetical protein